MAFFDNNVWLGYTDREYDTIKNAIISKLQNPVSGIPEITDHSQSNPFIRRVSIWASIAEMLGYYIDNKGRESFLLTAQLYYSAYQLAKQYDYRIRGKMAGSGQVTFKLNVVAPSNIVIPAETILSTEDGLLFLTLSNATIYTGLSEVTIRVKQWQKVALNQIGTTDGTENQIIELNENVVDGSLTLKVDGVGYDSVNTFSLTLPMQTVFKQQISLNKMYSIELADGINGVLDVPGKNITAEWYETTGLNVGAKKVNTLVSVLTLPTGVSIDSVSNELPITGGKDLESLEDLKKYIPLSLRTLYRAVTEQDYIDIAKLAPGVANAGVIYDCGKTVDVYISPNGGGLASSVLIANTLEFMDKRKMITTKLQIFAAGLVFVEHTILVRALSTFYNNDVKNNVLASLEAYYSNDNQEIGGVNYLGNIYQQVEASLGVESSDISMQPVPAALPKTPSQPVLNWTRKQKANSVNANYRIQFVNPTSYKLYRNNAFIGTYNINVLVSAQDLEFTILSGAYVAGNVHTFSTYLSSGNISLNEPSLLSYNVSYINITVIGGLS